MTDITPTPTKMKAEATTPSAATPTAPPLRTNRDIVNWIFGVMEIEKSLASLLMDGCGASGVFGLLSLQNEDFADAINDGLMTRAQRGALIHAQNWIRAYQATHNGDFPED